MTLTNKIPTTLQHSPLNTSLSLLSDLCKENDASVMDSYGNNRHQRGRGPSRLNNTNNDNEEGEEKVQYGHPETPPFIDHNNITAQDVMQQRLIERLHAEERFQLRQQNQQLLQLAQNQARRRQLLQLQLRQAVGNVSDPLSTVPLMDNNSLMLSPQQRNRQIEILRARRQNLMELHLLREQRLRREEELLEEVLRSDQRQASLTGIDGGMNLTASSTRLRSLPNSDLLLQPELSTSRAAVAAGTLPGIARLNPELPMTPRRIAEEQELIDRIIQNQRQQSLMFDVDDTIDTLDLSLSRLQERESNPFMAQINTAPASYRAIDPTRLDSGLPSLSRRHLTGQALGAANYMDSLQGVSSQPWMTSMGALGSYPSTEITSTVDTKPDEKKKPIEKKKSASRKKVPGMPKRPLHAYNIYFQEERQKILKEIPSPPENENDKHLTPGARRKRRRRGTHGKITFASLAKEIGFKWHNLSKERKEHYQQLAEIELKRYDDEMDAYNLKQKEKEKEEQDALDTKPKAKNVGADAGEEADEEEEEDDDDDEEDSEMDADEEEDSLSVTAVSAKRAREL